MNTMEASAQNFSYDVVLKGGVIISPNGRLEADLAICKGRIASIGALDNVRAARFVDCRGLHILPGVIDTHVHFREPGNTHKEDFASGSSAAVMGGVTSIFEMPNSTPQTTTVEALSDKLSRACDRMYCDFAFFVGATMDNIEQLADLAWHPGCCGVKVFMGSSTGNMLVEDSRAVSSILGKVTRCVAFHCEDEAMLRLRAHLRVEGDPSSHSIWRNDEVALGCTRRLLCLARETGKRVHVLHVSTAGELEALAAHRDIASIEVTPHHLTLLADETYSRLGSFAQMNPPLRGAGHQRMLWSAVHSGLVDVLGSDHAPHTKAEKSLPYPASPSGMPGVQTLVPVMLDHVHSGRLTLERFVDLSSSGPARIYGIACKGRIAEGYDADLTIVDLKRRELITDRWIVSKCGWTPFDGKTVTGWPVGVYVRGTCVMWQGELFGPPPGRPICFFK